jgi:hypothetical protein
MGSNITGVYASLSSSRSGGFDLMFVTIEVSKIVPVLAPCDLYCISSS